MSGQMWLFVTVPTVTAFIGYVTNWAAVKMIFHPAVPRGIGPLRWQGIVYRMAPKFAQEIAKTTGEVLSPADIVERVDIGGLVERLFAEHEVVLDRAVGASFDVLAPAVWDSMDPAAREQLRNMLLAQATGSVDGLVEALGDRLPDVLDLNALLVRELTGENAGRLARVTGEIAARELRFIELYGAVFGFGVGVVQAVLFGVFGIWWTMPIVGGIVGFGTNWLAIQMIFRPLEPRRFLGLVTYQGMFPKRQREIAADYGSITAREIFTPAKLLSAVAESSSPGASSAELRSLAVERLAEFRPMLAMVAGGSEPSDAVLGEVVDVLLANVLALEGALRPTVEAHLADSLRLDELIEDRLGSLDKEQFERMLRGIFEEDEWILVAIGGALGALIGVAQGLLVRSFDL
ncbi:DUF445 domain-containing protein [Actinospongicola halichondriae]|uniref:DUF445 domain-containing protein n=1 Tax=Actinospongicola halichondriae TaxID=3236844 RepID=UPI003D39BFF1